MNICSCCNVNINRNWPIYEWNKYHVLLINIFKLFLPISFVIKRNNTSGCVVIGK